MAGVSLCGPLVLEKEKYAKLEEQLKIISENTDSEAYRKYFLTLLNNFQTSIQWSSLLDIVKIDMSGIDNLRAAYYFKKGNKITLWVFFETRDWDEEDRVYDTYDRLLAIFPKFDIELKVLRLNGRQPEDLIPLGGVKLVGI